MVKFESDFVSLQCPQYMYTFKSYGILYRSLLQL